MGGEGLVSDGLLWLLIGDNLSTSSVGRVSPAGRSVYIDTVAPPTKLSWMPSLPMHGIPFLFALCLSADS